MTHEYTQGFGEEAFRDLDKSAEPALLRNGRAAAFEAYREIASPTTKMEEWRRTDPALFPFERMNRLPRLSSNGPIPASEWAPSFDAVISITDQTYSITDLSGVLNRNVIILPMEKAVAEFAGNIQDRLTGRERAMDGNKFEAMNAAFWNSGFLVHVRDNMELEKGILVQYGLGRQSGIHVPRLVVMAGARSRFTLVEQHASTGEAEFMAVTASRIYAGESARVKVVSLQDWGPNAYCIAHDWATLERDAQLEWIGVNFGSRVAKMTFGSDAAGDGAQTELDGLYFASDNQHLDQRTLQVHSAPNTFSRLLYKGAVKDKAYSVYQGMIIAKSGAIKVDAYQKNNNLVLNDGARADSLPGLQIDTDDLKCSHGSTIGNLDFDELFYLRSRGLDEAQARKILIQGFFEEVAAKIPYAFVKESVNRYIEERLERR